MVYINKIQKIVEFGDTLEKILKDAKQGQQEERTLYEVFYKKSSYNFVGRLVGK